MPALDKITPLQLRSFSLTHKELAMSPFLSEKDTSQDEALATFQNPIVPGFAPDPSVALVDGTFFLVASSFHIFPGIPIYASKDLQTWVHIGMLQNVDSIQLARLAH